MINLFEFGYELEGFADERGFAFEGVQHDAFDEVAEGKVVIFGEGFHDFEDALFDADAGLDAFNYIRRLAGSMVHTYQCTKLRSKAYRALPGSGWSCSKAAVALRARRLISFRLG
jgi:hypothetical protein